MREIKFRAWIPKPSESYMYYSIECTTLEEFFSRVEFADYDIMQFTGLKDKNGVDIYEGDIVKTKFGSIYNVDFVGGCFILAVKEIEYYSFTKNIAKQLEVIGNIYENPELIRSDE